MHLRLIFHNVFLRVFIMMKLCVSPKADKELLSFEAISEFGLKWCFSS